MEQEPRKNPDTEKALTYVKECAGGAYERLGEELTELFKGEVADRQTIASIQHTCFRILCEQTGAASEKIKFDVQASDDTTINIAPKNLYTAVALTLHRIVHEIVDDEGQYLDLDTGMTIGYYHESGAFVYPAKPVDFVRLDVVIGGNENDSNEAAEDQEHWDDADYVDGAP